MVKAEKAGGCRGCAADCNYLLQYSNILLKRKGTDCETYLPIFRHIYIFYCSQWVRTRLATIRSFVESLAWPAHLLLWVPSGAAQLYVHGKSLLKWKQQHHSDCFGLDEVASHRTVFTVGGTCLGSLVKVRKTHPPSPAEGHVVFLALE